MKLFYQTKSKMFPWIIKISKCLLFLFMCEFSLFERLSHMIMQSLNSVIIARSSYQTTLFLVRHKRISMKSYAARSVISTDGLRGKSEASIRIIRAIRVIHTLPLLINNLHSTQLHRELERRKYVTLYTAKRSSPIHSSSSTTTTGEREQSEEKQRKNTTSVWKIKLKNIKLFSHMLSKQTLPPPILSSIS